MSGGLLPAPEPRRRGRPKGSTNRRSRELADYVSARFGGSAAQQAAQLALVTPAELKAAGGSMAKALVNKALDLVQHVRDAQEGRDEWLRRVVRQELEEVAASIGGEAAELRKVVNGFLARVREAGGGFSLADALELIAKERAALMPYTDKRQPLAIEAKGEGFSPSVVVQIEASAAAVMPAEAIEADFVEVFQPAAGLVARSKSHGEGQGVDPPELFPPDAAD
jgi:hypothetical protein